MYSGCNLVEYLVEYFSGWPKKYGQTGGTKIIAHVSTCSFCAGFLRVTVETVWKHDSQLKVFAYLQGI